MTELTNVLTEKGNLKTAALKAIKAEGTKHLETLGFTKMPNGKFAMTIATTEGHTITMNLEMTIGLDTDFTHKAKEGKTEKATEKVELPNLFD